MRALVAIAIMLLPGMAWAQTLHDEGLQREMEQLEKRRLDTLRNIEQQRKELNRLEFEIDALRHLDNTMQSQIFKDAQKGAAEIGRILVPKPPPPLQ